ncbi:opacity family porin [Moraxella porci]|nr:opacity family porin [Moraxella porci]MDH2273804.1 opacity family porin [Moraxella porci]
MITATAANASIYDTPTDAGQWYWQADLGYSELDFDFGESNRTEDGVGGRISIGKDKGNYRYAYDYSYFGNAEDNDYYRSGTTYIHDEYNVYAHSIGASAFYDFKNASRLTPYVGARVGVNFLSDELRRCVSSYSMVANSAATAKTITPIRVLASAASWVSATKQPLRWRSMSAANTIIWAK